MPKGSKKKRKVKRHDPLEKQIIDSLELGYLKAPKKSRDDEDDVESAVTEDFVSDRMSAKILSTAQEQQAEIAQGSAWGPILSRDTETKTAPDGDDSDLEQEELLDETEEIEEIDITAADESELAMFMPTSTAPRKTLADMIMEKIREKQAGAAVTETASQMGENALDPKLVAVYSQVGEYLAVYTSGKVPKAFKIIPSLRNWEEVLLLTNPEKWTPQAFFIATRLFSSNLNEKMAQRFFNIILLPKLREDIEVKKKLNFHLYGSVKKAVYKPAAFFRGIVLPLAAEGCTTREALIFASILSKISIPALHSSVALLKFAEMPYSGPVTLFMKTILDKKYSLPYRVVDSLTKYFVGFNGDKRRLPVIWHQNLLMFVQRYKNDLTAKQRNSLKNVLRKHQHERITPEIRRELFATPASSVMMEM